jgi:hypothetical protein
MGEGRKLVPYAGKERRDRKRIKLEEKIERLDRMIEKAMAERALLRAEHDRRYGK